MHTPSKIKPYNRDHAPNNPKFTNCKLYKDHFHHMLAHCLAHSKWPSTHLINF